MNRPHEVMRSPQEGEALIERIEQERWMADDRHVVVQVLRMSCWVLFALQEAKLSLTRLRTLLFGDPAPRRRVPSSRAASDIGGADSGERGDSSSGVATGTIEGPSRPAGGHRPGQGRLGAASYAGAERGACRHEELRVGEVCPVCGQGRLYALPPGVEMRLDGNALLSAIRYEVEKLRCSACGAVFPAALPDGTGEEKYSARARAVLVLGRYSLGLPLNGMEAYEATLIRCHCLAHGRRKFSELEEVFPDECKVVIEALKQVFEHDEAARIQQMSTWER